MTDLAGGNGDGSGTGAGTGEGGGVGGGDGGGGAQAPEWMATLPEALHGDATLSRYPSIEALAQGHLETKRMASSRLAIPAADAGPEAWAPVYEALGRPKDAAAYDFAGIEGLSDEAVAGFRPIAHKLGFNAAQARGLAEYDAARLSAAQDAYFAKGDADVTALKTELGAEFEPKVAAAKAAFAKMGFDAKFADELDKKVGSAALLRGFMTAATLLGEHGRADGEDGGHMGSVADDKAQETLSTLFKDKAWREKFNAGDASTVAEHKRLTEAAKRHAAKDS